MSSKSVRTSGRSQEFGQIVNAVQRSILLKVAIAGVALIVSAYFLGNEVIGVWSALLPIWGSAMIGLGGGLYVTLWWIRRN